MDSNAKIEKNILELGGQIYSSMKDAVPTLFDKKRWKAKVLLWTMNDERLKINLFRFVDTLPVLKDDKKTVGILKEYFTEDTNKLAELFQWGISGLASNTLLSKITASVVRKNIESLAKSFIAAPAIDESIPVISAMRSSGYAVSIDLLGEQILSSKESDIYCLKYLDLMDALSKKTGEWSENTLLDNDMTGGIGKADISLKISAFCPTFDPVDYKGSIKGVKGRLYPVIKKAVESNTSVTVDMEHYYLKSLTIDAFITLVEELRCNGSICPGIAIQTYLKDSERDLLKLIKWAKKSGNRISIRLVKGAYWDYETVIHRQKGWPIPVFLEKCMTDINYEKLTRILLENCDYIRPAFATHSIRSIAHALAYSEYIGLKKNAFECQILYGMAEPIASALKDMGYRVRIYTPVGRLLPGMSYLVRRLLENTSNESFLRRSFAEHEPFNTLIQPPISDVNNNENMSTGSNKTCFANEPATDFSIDKNREGMKAALGSVKSIPKVKYSPIINGIEVEGKGEIVSVNPAEPCETIGVVSCTDIKGVENAVTGACKAGLMWAETQPEDRAACLFKAAEEIRHSRFELSSLMILEVGKSWKEADAEVSEAIDFLEFYGQQAILLGREKQLGHYPGEINHYRYIPRGTGAVIAPWNFPLAISCGMISAAIAAGNTVIYKPSSNSPVAGARLVDIFMRTGLPAGVLQFTPGYGSEIGDFLVSHPSIDFIAFTGSMETGLAIAEKAGKTVKAQKNIKKVILEMGGKNAIIIDESADMDEAVKGVGESFLGYQGQKCSACSRVIIADAVKTEFLMRIKEYVKSLPIGPPEDPENRIGPVIDKNALEKIRRYIEIGKEEGVCIVSRDVPESGCFIGPAIFSDISPKSKIAQEEIFGPVLSVLSCTSIDEAIEMANSTPFALTGGLYSRSPENIKRVKRGFRVGNLYINRPITGALVGRQPFGGFGMSGTGTKAGGEDYLYHFLLPLSITENTIRKGFSCDTARCK